ncbi:FliO/MopB family protein [Patulibacter defluvii]|uniref:FliO/MopB family protein n=1 Tax=Patulibacter defluvii TaxID=3095358 RepID=UPI002A7570CF|nr:flagellar biosynthetic protein FliO [Patulibacter sp. DM4]
MPRRPRHPPHRRARRPPRARRALGRATLAAASAPLLTAALARAADDRGERTPIDLGDGADAATGHVGSGGGLARTIVGLLVVVAVIYGISWILRQVKRSREQPLGQGLTSVASLPLAPGGALHLVRAGDEYLLLATGSGGATTVARYDADEARRRGLLPEDEDDDGAGPPPAVRRRAPLDELLDRLRARTVRR